MFDAIRFGGSGWGSGTRFNTLPPSPDRSAITYVTGFGAAHSTGLNALFVDGSVRQIRYDLSTGTITTSHGSESIFQLLCDRSDGSAIDWSQID
jgi:prepilin-type processing-associated H-X9-DG protein